MSRPRTRTCGSTSSTRSWYGRMPRVSGKVGLISGGGSGHEPLHGGFVGAGMLDAACPGEVFTSPVPDQILAATKAVDGGAGVVHIVKNYTGDVLNFQMAAELAGDDGVRVETVLVDDDVAVENSTWTAGRRGTTATLIVEKVAGAAAAEGQAARGRRRAGPTGERELRVVRGRADRVHHTGRRQARLRPARRRDGGRRRHPRRARPPAREAASVPRRSCGSAWTRSRRPSPLGAGDRAIVIVNGLGGTPLIELYLVFGEVAAVLKDRRRPDRAQPRGQLRHQPRHGRHVGDGVPGR